MPEFQKPARLVKWSPRNSVKKSWYVFYYDHKSGKPRRLNCKANGKNTGEQRSAWINEIRSEQIELAHQRQTHGTLSFDTPLSDCFDDYFDEVGRRVILKDANPGSGDGITEKTATIIRNCIGKFRVWLSKRKKSSVTTGHVDLALLKAFFGYLETTKTKNGERETLPSIATVNQYRRNIRAFFKFVDSLRPKRIPDIAVIAKSWKASPENSKTELALRADDLRNFIATALEKEDSGYCKTVKRRKRGSSTMEEFKLPARLRSATPVSRLFLVLALTGCRRSEARMLRWQDVNLDAGVINFVHRLKKGKFRFIQLIGGHTGDIAPRFLELLKCWRKESPKAEFVLPTGTLIEPTYPKHAWGTVNDEATERNITPQSLRSNFTSYARILGMPAAICAQLQGHSADIAEKHYQRQVAQTSKGNNFEDAMGLTRQIEKVILEFSGS